MRPDLYLVLLLTILACTSGAEADGIEGENSSGDEDDEDEESESDGTTTADPRTTVHDYGGTNGGMTGGQDANNNAMVVGAVIGGILAGVLLTLALGWFIYHKRKRSTTVKLQPTTTNGTQNGQEAQTIPNNYGQANRPLPSAPPFHNHYAEIDVLPPATNGFIRNTPDVIDNAPVNYAEIMAVNNQISNQHEMDDEINTPQYSEPKRRLSDGIYMVENEIY